MMMLATRQLRHRSLGVRLFSALLVLTGAALSLHSESREARAPERKYSTCVPPVLDIRGVDKSRMNGTCTEKLLESAVREEHFVVIVIDMWDSHWCPTAVEQANILAPKINDFLTMARSRGAKVIHAPYGLDNVYGQHPQRLMWCEGNHSIRNPVIDIKANKRQVSTSPASLEWAKNCKNARIPFDPHMKPAPWKSIHQDIHIEFSDVISTDPLKVYSFLKSFSSEKRASVSEVTLVYVGLHLNQCILFSRPASIVQMRTFGIKTAIVAHLSDIDDAVEEIHGGERQALKEKQISWMRENCLADIWIP